MEHAWEEEEGELEGDKRKTGKEKETMKKKKRRGSKEKKHLETEKGERRRGIKTGVNNQAHEL